MSTDTALIEKREELKRRLAAGEYKTLVDIFLEWFDRLIRKITRRTKPIPILYIIIILTLVYYLSFYVVAYFEGNLDTLYRLGDLTRSGPLFVLFSMPAFYVTSLVVINQYIHRIFILWRDAILDATESVTSLEEFKNWMGKACSWRLHLLVTVSGGLLGGLYVTTLSSSAAGVFMGYWYAFGATFLFLYLYAFVYLVLVTVLLSAMLRRYDMNLFAADPSSSELVSLLSGVLGSVVYFVAVFAAYNTLSAAFIGFFLPLSIITVFVLWLPIIAMFALNQTSLTSIIRRAKWKTLNEIQAKVERLQATDNFEEKETMEAINRLMDYHDRVKRTRNSAIDLSTTLNFINSLLLPLLAFVIGNLSLVLSLFKKQP